MPWIHPVVLDDQSAENDLPTGNIVTQSSQASFCNLAMFVERLDVKFYVC